LGKIEAALAILTKKSDFCLRKRAKNKSTKNRKIFIVQLGVLMLSLKEKASVLKESTPIG
jgi:hypothetical protein